MTVFQILEKIHLNHFTKEYEKIYILKNKPNDEALSKHLKLIAKNKLSPFDDFHNTENHCYYAFVSPKNSHTFVQKKDVEDLINIIIDSGYKIEYNMMKLINKREKGNIFCFISK